MSCQIHKPFFYETANNKLDQSTLQMDNSSKLSESVAMLIRSMIPDINKTFISTFVGPIHNLTSILIHFHYVGKDKSMKKPIACIHLMKNLLLWARLTRIYIWNNELKRAKDATCEWTLCYHNTECNASACFLSTVPRCKRMSWISQQ